MDIVKHKQDEAKKKKNIFIDVGSRMVNGGATPSNNWSHIYSGEAPMYNQYLLWSRLFY